jgi:hypothetical protein
MQNRKETSQEVTRRLTGISHILDSIAVEATAETKAQIEQAKRILLMAAQGSDNPFFPANTLQNTLNNSTPALFNTENITTRKYNIKDFQNIEFDCAFIFEISYGSEYNVSVTANESLFEKISVVQSGDILKFFLKPVRFQARPILEAKITLPVLNRLRQSAATCGMVTGFQMPGLFDLYLSGASSTEVNLECGEAHLEITGASHVSGNMRTGKADLLVSGASSAKLSGQCENLSLSGWGAADMDLAKFRSQEGTVYLKGASIATVQVLKQLNVDMTGASHLRYLSNPTLNEITLSGASVLCQDHRS